jgi:hypothetical protein
LSSSSASSVMIPSKLFLPNPRSRKWRRVRRRCSAPNGPSVNKRPVRPALCM